jgi:acetyltransferase-like isoleucine patch superfamily enzyme
MLTDRQGVAVFPGGEARAFSSRYTFYALARSLRLSGGVTPVAYERCMAALSGQSWEGGPENLPSHAKVAAYRKYFGALYDTALEQFDKAISAPDISRASLRAATAAFVDALCEEVGQRNDAHTVVIDQGVRAWAPQRAVFYGATTVIIMRRDVRDQIIERLRHGYDIPGFEAEMLSRTARMKAGIARLPKGTVHEGWFENLIMDHTERDTILGLCGLADAPLKTERRFNPLSSRKNIALHQQRPDLVDYMPEAEPVYFPGVDSAVAERTLELDRIGFANIEEGAAGAYRRTGSLDDIPIRTPKPKPVTTVAATATDITRDVHPTATVSARLTCSGPGQNNRFIVGENVRLGALKILFRGNNNTVVFGPGGYMKRGTIKLYGDNQTVSIGPKSTIESAYFLASEGQDITIGEDCMISFGVSFRTTDAHSLIDKATGERVNHARSIILGDHIWIAADVIVGKGVSIANDVMVGARSFVNKSVAEESCVVVGTPARIMRRGTTWSRKKIPPRAPQ